MGKRKQSTDARNALDSYAASLGLTRPVVPLWMKLVGGAFVTFVVALKLAIIGGAFWLAWLLVSWIITK